MTLRLGRLGRGRVEVDGALPPSDEVEGGSERVAREGTRSVDAVKGGGWSGAVSDGGFDGGRMTVVGRVGGGMTAVAFLLLEIVEKGFRFEESCGRGNAGGVIDKSGVDRGGSCERGGGKAG